jgi:hypothetical protein
LLLSLSSPARAGAIQLAHVEAFLHAGGSLATRADATSDSFAANLDADGLGTLEWTFVNTTNHVMSDVHVFGFVDADLDRSLNTFFNEYGSFISLVPPSGTPGGATGASSWEIDEPGFLYGDVLTHLVAGSLDDSNAVPSGSPDDVALALGFNVGDLRPGDTVRLLLQLSVAPIGGLRQTDAHSASSFYLNGYAVTSAPVPEPATAELLLLGVAATRVARRVRQPGESSPRVRNRSTAV